MRRFLEDAGTYNAFIVNNKASAVVRADEESCSAAFLDMNLGAQWVEDIGRSLRTVLPEIKLFVLAEDEAPPALDSIRPWTLVSKPFQSPELIKAIERPVSRPVISSASPSASGEMD